MADKKRTFGCTTLVGLFHFRAPFPCLVNVTLGWRIIVDPNSCSASWAGCYRDGVMAKPNLGVRVEGRIVDNPPKLRDGHFVSARTATPAGTIPRSYASVIC